MFEICNLLSYILLDPKNLAIDGRPISHFNVNEFENPLHGRWIVLSFVLVCGDARTEFLIIALVNSLAQPLYALHERIVHGYGLATGLPKAVDPFVLAEFFSEGISVLLELLFLFLKHFFPPDQLIACGREDLVRSHLE